MTNFIPIFPLSIVVYPGEKLNLHIFEPRYKQLIAECYAQSKQFGIPSVINNKLQDYGTLIQITEITKVYGNGEMDIKTKGNKVFRILEIIEEIPEKLYSGAIVNYPHTVEQGNPEIMRRLLNSMQELHRLLKVKKDLNNKKGTLKAYDIAHHIGLSIEEEYELLHLLEEGQRQEYIKRHLTKIIPLVAELEQLKEKIKLNGHFRNIKGLGFR